MYVIQRSVTIIRTQSHVLKEIQAIIYGFTHIGFNSPSSGLILKVRALLTALIYKLHNYVNHS